MQSKITWFCWVVAIALSPVRAANLNWFGDANTVNHDSLGVAMDAGFHFELGAFSDGFIPSVDNLALWKSHWVKVDTAAYAVSTMRFAGSLAQLVNTAPFSVGSNAWVFGCRDSATGSEWILFRKSTWTWPVLNPDDPNPIEWNAKDADQVVFGAVNTAGSPVLMKSGAIQSFAQWQQAQDLTSAPLNGPTDDANHNGVPNLVEFALGASASTPNQPVQPSVQLVDGHTQISIPRQVNPLAIVTVEVSGNLLDWHSGPDFTDVIQDNADGLIVRDKTVQGESDPKRFIRFKVELP